MLILLGIYSKSKLLEMVTYNSSNYLTLTSEGAVDDNRVFWFNETNFYVAFQFLGVESFDQ